MKVVNLEVENFMGVKAVEITPDGPVITIGGKNGQGKSSILNAMISALAGAKELPGVAVRDGEESAVTRVVLSRPEGDLHITRTVKSDGKTTLTVKSADGAKYGKPQQLLDALVGAVGFDPYEFTRLDAKKQSERLRQLVGIDTTTIDLEAEQIYRERTDVAPVKGRKPLTDTRGFYWYMLVENGQRIVGSGCALWETVKKLQLDYPNSRIVQCMAPNEIYQCPTQYVDNVELDCEIEWAIYGTGGDMWLCPSTTGLDYSWRAEPFNARRWEARNGAQSYINIHKIDAAIPFPVPKIKEEK